MDKVLELVRDDINEERRRYNKLLLAFLEGEEDIFNKEDLYRLCGVLNNAYNLCIANNKVELLSMLSYAVVLAGEVDGRADRIISIISSFYDISPLLEE